MQIRKIWVPCIALILLASAEDLSAGDSLSGRAIVEASDKAITSNTEDTFYRMELVDKQGNVQQTRTLHVYFKRGDKKKSTLQKFASPPMFANTSTLIEDTGAEYNDIWVYLPATRRIRRISGAEKSNWYMGTEFTYEDFEGYQLNWYDYELLREGACGKNSSCYVVKAQPSNAKERAASGYQSKIYWIDKDSLFPIRVDYIGMTGIEVKRLSTLQLQKISGYWRAGVIEMSNLENGRKTRLITLERKIDQALQDYYVSQRFLRTE